MNIVSTMSMSLVARLPTFKFCFFSKKWECLGDHKTPHMHIIYCTIFPFLAHCVSRNLFLEDHLDGKNTYSSYFVKRKDNLETRSPRNRPFLNLMVKRRWLKYYCVTQIYQELQKLLAYLVSILTHVHHPPKTLSIYMKVIEQYYIYSWYK